MPLRRRLLVITAACAAVLLLAMAALLLVSERRRTALAEMSQSLVEEQQVADQVVDGVMRQLALSAAGAGLAPDSIRTQFEAASATVHASLRSYLFRQLTVAERLQIERIKEEHELMEVAARRLQQLSAGPVGGERVELRTEVMRHALVLREELSSFFRMREDDLADAAASQAETIRWFWLASALTAALTGLGIWVLLARFLQRRVVEPLGHLAAAANRVGDGDLTVRVPVEGDRELRELAHDFNAMTEQLAAAQGALARRNVELESALEQVRRAQDDLVQSEKLGAVGRMSAGLAHELNNPLASVVGNAELLAAEVKEHGHLEGPRAAELLDPIVREATRARQLVRSLLQYSRQADAGVGSVSLPEALAIVADLRAFAFERAGLRLCIEPLPAIWVRAEQQRLQAVMMNIVNNALQAMQGVPGGALRVSSVAEGDMVEVRFDDDGPGIERPDRIFEPFYTTKEPGQGTGLGLSLAAAFIESFGGVIRASNRPEGGARVIVWLPAAAPPDAMQAREPGPAVAVRRAAEGQRVLVVEDEPELRRLQGRLLTRIGVTVLTAGSLAEAKERLEAGTVDAVVSDVRMPGGSGIELYRWVEQQRPALAGRFLFVTGDVDVPELADLGMADEASLLHKPFAMADYIRRVRALLER